MSRRYHICQSIAFLLLLTIGLQASTDPALHLTQRMQLSNEKEQLDNNLIRVIRQDSLGFIWLGTNDGLYRFDGYQTKKYTIPPDTGAISNPEYITALCPDQNGILWIGTYNHGLFRLDTKTDKIRHYSLRPKSENPDRGEEIRDLALDKNGHLWILIPKKGLYRFHPDTEKYEKIFASFEHWKGMSHRFNEMIEDDPYVWLAGYNCGLVRVHKMTREYQIYGFQDSSTAYLNRNCLFSLYKDQQGNIWSGCKNGINRLDQSTGEYSHLRFVATDESSCYVLAILEYREGRFLLGTSQGLYLFTERSGRSTKINLVKNNPTEPETRIRSLFCDQSGNLWIGTIRKGAFCYTTSMQGLQHIPYPTLAHTSDPITISTMRADSSHLLWIGSNSGLYFYHLTHRKYEHFGNSADHPLNSLPVRIRQIFDDQAGSTWIASDEGLYQWTGRQNRLQHFRHNPSDPQSLARKQIYAIDADSQGQIWLTFHDGIGQWNRDHQRMERFISTGDICKGFTFHGLSVDNEDQIWITIRNCGLFRLLDRSTNPTLLHGNMYSTPGLGVAFHNSPVFLDHKIWLSTSKAGICCFTPEDSSVITLNRDDGLIDNYVISLLPDQNGRLWVQTDRGLSHYDPATKTFSNFAQSDGLSYCEPFIHQRETDCGASCRDASGKLYFAGVGGIDCFHPDSIFLNYKQPNLVLTQIETFNTPLQTAQTIAYTKSIRLRHNQNYLTFSFALLDYREPGKNRIFYRLQGLENEWKQCNGHRITYAYLKPDMYTLELRGISSKGIKSRNWIQLDIKILPPFWQTWLFRIGAVMFLIASVVGYTFHRIRSSQAESDRMKELVIKRTKELNREHLRYQELFENASDIIFTTDLAGRIQAVNQQFEDISGYPKSEILEKDTFHFVNPSYHPLIKKMHQRCIRGQAVQYEIVFASKKGEQKSLWIKKRPIYEEGRVIGTQGIARDITSLRKAETQIREAAREKRESIRHLTLQLAHEIKNPLTTIKSSAQLVHDSDQSCNEKNVSRHMQRICNNVDICNRVIRSLYDFTQAPQYEYQDTRLSRILQQIEDYMLLVLETHPKITFHRHVKDQEIILRCDEFQILAAFRNIIKNSIEAMPDGGEITLRTELGKSRRHVKISIIDTGEGMDFATTQRIFQPFFSTKPFGFGFGIPLVKEIIEAHDGQMEIKSREGTGTHIIITLPCQRKGNRTPQTKI